MVTLEGMEPLCWNELAQAKVDDLGMSRYDEEIPTRKKSRTSVEAVSCMEISEESSTYTESEEESTRREYKPLTGRRVEETVDAAVAEHDCCPSIISGHTGSSKETVLRPSSPPNHWPLPCVPDLSS